MQYEAINDRVSLFVAGEVIITTETPEDVAVVDEDAVEVTEPVIDYIVFTSEEAGNSIVFRAYSDYEGDFDNNNISFISFYYSYNNVNYTQVNIGTPISFDNMIYIKGKTNSGATYSINEERAANIHLSENASVSGNIMALLDYENISTVSMNDYAFEKLFYDCDKLTDASRLELPTTLSDFCFSSMFSGCTSLSSAPALPTTTLVYSCYENMFSGCTSLATAPVLPATSLAEMCYENMFHGCTSLATAPALPATTLAYSCYDGMFYGCTSLATAPALPATTLAESCYKNMFRECTSLVSAPILSASSLAEYCYEGMFMGCTSLSSVTCLATTTAGVNYNCFSGWLDSAAASGTLYKNPLANFWEVYVNVPNHWTIVDYTE